MELNDDIYDQITDLAEEGDALLSNEKLEEALKKYTSALNLLPAPKSGWEASTWLYTAIGDVHFVAKDYDLALEAYTTVLRCPDGISNPYTWLMIGQSHYEMDQYEKAKENLLRAYMLDGKEIFEGEDTKYFKLIEGLVDEKA